MHQQLLIILWITTILDGVKVSESSNKLFVILVDGFRWDYFDQIPDLKGFPRMFANGVKADYMVPVMPTTSYPNQYSIMTGLYAENHGIVSNHMYDPDHGAVFRDDVTMDNSSAFWWDGGEPLWVTAAKQGKRAYMYRYNGCDVTIKGKRPALCLTMDWSKEAELTESKPWRDTYLNLVTAFEDEMMKALHELQSDNADVAAIHYPWTSTLGRNFGPGSKEVQTDIRVIDGIINKLQNQLEYRRMQDGRFMVDAVNVMVVSDHGMSNLTNSSMVNLADYVNMADIQRWQGASVWPKPGNLMAVYNAINSAEHINVYMKLDIPEWWNLAKSKRIGPIYISAGSGWDYQIPGESPSTWNMSGDSYPHGGFGYDNTNEDMRTIFVARGPGFKKDFKKTGGFLNIELYQVMCHLLDIEAAPHNGTWKHISDILTLTPNGGSSEPSFTSVYIVMAVAVSSSILCLILYLLCGNSKPRDRISRYQKVEDGSGMRLLREERSSKYNKVLNDGSDFDEL